MSLTGRNISSLELLPGNTVEVVAPAGASVVVALWYPDFTDASAPPPKATISLEHVRAARELAVWFDGKRNGYVIADADDEAELAFIDAMP